jgi:hypothetical protein
MRTCGALGLQGIRAASAVATRRICRRLTADACSAASSASPMARKHGCDLRNGSDYTTMSWWPREESDAVFDGPCGSFDRCDSDRKCGKICTALTL